MEQQHRDRVGDPVLLALIVNAAEPVDSGLDRAQDWRQERAFAIENACHVPAERLRQRDDDDEKENDLEPTDHSHGIQSLMIRLKREKKREEEDDVRQAVSRAEALQKRSGRNSA